MNHYQAFWQKNKESDSRQYIHRREYEQIFVDLNGKYLAERRQKEKYRSKWLKTQHKLKVGTLSSVRSSTAHIERKSHNKDDKLKEVNNKLSAQLTARQSQAIFEQYGIKIGPLGFDDNEHAQNDFDKLTARITDLQGINEELETVNKELQTEIKNVRGENEEMHHKFKDQVIDAQITDKTPRQSLDAISRCHRHSQTTETVWTRKSSPIRELSSFIHASMPPEFQKEYANQKQK